MNSTEVINHLKAKRELPTPPGVAMQLLEVLRDSSAGAPEVASILECDPVLTTRILAYANSPLVGPSAEVSSLSRAITLLGMRRVAVLALTYCFVDTKQSERCPAFDCDAFWQESIARGVIARQLARQVARQEAEEVFVAGLVSNMGRLLLANGFSDVYQIILPNAADRDSLQIAEHETFGTTSNEVGLSLLKEWHFPEQFIEDVREANSLRSGTDPLTERFAPRCLSMAQLAAEAMVEPADRLSPGNLEQMIDQASRWLGLSQEAWEEQFDASVVEWREQCEVLDISSHRVRSFAEIERDARDQLAALSMEAVTQSEQMLARATTDSLTKIPNRSYFDERMELEVERFRRNGGDLLVMLLDIDEFKALNDTHGHQAGDKMLQAVAEKLADEVRRIDMAARYGGEEFAIIAPQCKRENAEIIADRIRESVAAIACEHDGQPLQATVSIGGAFARMAGCTEAIIQDVIGRADVQLYKAKENGRNQIHVDPTDLPSGVSACHV